MTLSLTGARWTPILLPAERLLPLLEEGLSEVAARCLAIRFEDHQGILDPPTLDQLHDPYTMHNMGIAVDRLHAATHDKQHIRIITDYDVDGTTSSLILQAAVRLLNRDVRVDYHIPNRFGEGYGFSPQAAEQAHRDGVDLIVTADIGVRDHAAVAHARERGIDVLICDHHLPAGADVPADATVLCPPQRTCSYPNASLAACGVSLKLAQALLGQHPKWHNILTSLLKLAAIGTVADLVSLTTAENRAIVTLGLQALNRGGHHAGLSELLRVSNLTPGAIRESDLGYRIGPRINAAGRLDDAKLVVRLLNCRNPTQAASMAKQIDSLNTNRKEIQRRVEQHALDNIEDPPPDFVVVAGEERDGWHRGVVGIVASRLKETLNRPVAVVSIQNDLAVGSVRSVPGVHAVRALDSCADILVKYGGHPAAAGFTVPTDQLDLLRERLNNTVARTDLDLVPVRDVDAELVPADLVDKTFFELSRLGPFGMGNPKPRLLLRGIRPARVKQLGQQGKMLKFEIPTPGGRPVPAIWWGHGDQAELFEHREMDLLGTLEENIFRGRRTLQFAVQDARLSQ